MTTLLESLLSRWMAFKICWSTLHSSGAFVRRVNKVCGYKRHVQKRSADARGAYVCMLRCRAEVELFESHAHLCLFFLMCGSRSKRPCALLVAAAPDTVIAVL